MANTTAGATKLPGYETTFITRAEMTDEALKTLQDKIVGLFPAYKGELILQEDWGKRKLAYPIQKEARGHYTYVVYTGTGDVVAEVERNLRLQEHVLRFLTVNLEKEFDSEIFTKRRADLQAAAKRREEEREARREERMAERRGYDDHSPRQYDRSSRDDSAETSGAAGAGTEE